MTRTIDLDEHRVIVDELTANLYRELTGKGDGDLLHVANPERYHPVGILYPQDENDTSIRPSSAGLRIKVNDNVVELGCNIYGHIYMRREPTLIEQTEHLERIGMSPTGVRISLANCWVQFPFHAHLSLKRDQDGKELLDEVIKESCKRRSFVSVPYSLTRKEMDMTEAPGREWKDDKDFQSWIKTYFEKRGPTPLGEDTHNMEIEWIWKDDEVKIYAINKSTSKKDRSWYLLDQNIYGLEIEMELGEQNSLIVNEKDITNGYLPPERIITLGEGRNLQLSWENNRLWARSIGFQELPKTIPIDDIDGVNLSFDSLSKGQFKTLDAVSKYLDSARKRYQQKSDYLNNDYSKRAVHKLALIEQRYNHGVELLRSNGNLNKAFQLMNETFRRHYICNDKVTGWRLFQLVYIVSKFKDVVGEPTDEFDVIFVQTGGGKTETYFGLLVTELFYQRLCGINFGSLALVKFPLRALAIDQIQRFATIIAMADMVRVEAIPNNGDYQGKFSIGLMIGGTKSESTPNRVNDVKSNDEDEEMRAKADLRAILENSPQMLKVIFDCPVCRYNAHMSGHNCNEEYDSIKISYDPKEVRAQHFCEKCHSRFEIHWTDEEVFRYLPSIIISTQDRIAYGAFAPYVRNLLGAPLHYCKQHGFSPYSSVCTAYKEGGGYGKKNGTCPVLKTNGHLDPVTIPPHQRAIKYIIQDEMHLLRSDLGALDSPFERMFADVILQYSGRRPLYIGMSATVNDVETQVQELYGLSKSNVWIFPGYAPRGSSEREYFDAFFKHFPILQRRFLGCVSSSDDTSTVVQRAIEITTKWIHIWEIANRGDRTSLPRGLQCIDIDALAKALTQYRVNLAFMNTKIDLERTIQNIENITNIERSKSVRINNDISIPVNVEELTGDNSIQDIRLVIKSIKLMSEEIPEKRLDALIATNLISHGIDLRQLNIMIFYGMPGSTSEYIQALSRVGRVNPGIVLTIFNTKKVRDRGLWRTFQPYHQALYEQVEVMPVDHRAPGIVDETLITLLRCYWNLVAEPIITTDSQALYSLRSIVENNLNGGRQMLIDDASARIEMWLSSNQKTSELVRRVEDYLDSLYMYYEQKQTDNWKDKRALASPPPNYSELLKVLKDQFYVKKWMETMTGIRGIQENIKQKPDTFALIYLPKISKVAKEL